MIGWIRKFWRKGEETQKQILETTQKENTQKQIKKTPKEELISKLMKLGASKEQAQYFTQNLGEAAVRSIIQNIGDNNSINFFKELNKRETEQHMSTSSSPISR